MIRGIGDFMTKLFGIEVKPNFKKNDYKEFNKIIGKIKKISEQYEKIDKSEAPKEVKLKQKMQAMDTILSVFGLGSMKEFATAYTEAWNPDITFRKHIPNVDYLQEKRKSLHNIIFALEKTGTLQKFYEFNDSIGDTAFDLTQITVKLTEKFPYLLKERKRMAKLTVEKFLEIYKNLVSAFVEFAIVYLFGVQKVLRGISQPYPTVRKGRISDKIKELRKDLLFRTFVEKYDNNIRNSIIHGGYHIDLVSKKIHFTNKKTTPKSFQEFVTHVQEITRNALLIIGLKYEINYLMLVNSKKALDSIRK